MDIKVNPEKDLGKKKKNADETTFIDVLKIFSPGTVMRTAFDDILRARMGALVVVDKEGFSSICEGGFKVNCKFSSQRLVELAKMDGAIILSSDRKKILSANTLLVPNINLHTSETGTRHRAAERTSKQFKTIVVAVSERRNKITLYWGDEKHVLEKSSEILRRATETLQILEKQKDIFEDALLHLNILEITNLATTSDVCNVLQRMEIIRRISESVKRYLVELGKEGIIVSMRLKELTRNLSSEREMILIDYFKSRAPKIKTLLNNMNFDFLLETSNIVRLIFEKLHDESVSGKGERILSKINLLEKERRLLMTHFKTLDKVFDADKESLLEIVQRQAIVDSLKEKLENLREKILNGKRI